MAIDKTLQPPFIHGYTEGFCDGLTGLENVHRMPEEEWTSDGVLDIESRRSHTSYITDVEENSSEYRRRYKKIGYNWGHLHGSKQRKQMIKEIPEGPLEKRLSLLAETIKREFLKSNRKGKVCYRQALDPKAENQVHVAYTKRFVLDLGKEKRDIIIRLVHESKIQQAIDNSIDFFDHLKDLEKYLQAITLEGELKHLRNLRKNAKISQDDYLEAMAGLGKAIEVLVKS